MTQPDHRRAPDEIHCERSDGGAGGTDPPVRPPEAAPSELLGIDPLYVANAGKFVAVVAPDEAAVTLSAPRRRPLGRESVQIGEIRAEPPGIVVLITPQGGTRIVDMLVGDPLP